MNIFYIVAISFIALELLLIIGAVGMVQMQTEKIETRLKMQERELTALMLKEWSRPKDKLDKRDKTKLS